jgi:hypothetical protein
LSLLAASLIVGVLLEQPGALPSGSGGEVVCTGPLPFSAEEVQEALVARWHLLGRAAVVGVRSDRGRTWVRVGPVEREVDLGGRAGEEAARLVAVIALDLAQDESSFAASASPPASVSAAASSGSELAPPSRGRRTFRVGLSLLSPFDQSGVIARVEPTVAAAFEVVPGFGAFVTAGYRHASAAADASTSVVLQELPVRLGAAFRTPWLELRVGGLARSRFVEGPRSYRAVAWGAAASVATRLPLSPRVALELAGGFDIFRTRMVFAVSEDVALTTPWLCPWVGAGIAWEAAL